MAEKTRNNSLIDVEGPDGSGKTTIAKELAKKLGYKYFERDSSLKADTSKQHPPEYYENLGRKLSKKLKKELEKNNIVIARYVYSISALNYANSKKRRAIIKDVIEPDYIIYCYASDEILRERLKLRKSEGNSLYHHEKDVEKYKRLCKRYKEIFSNKDNVIKIDTSEKTPEESVREIMEKL